jgi:hypothetical protein
MAKKYATEEERKEAQRRLLNKRRNGDDIERPRGRPYKYRTREEAKAAKLENQRFWRQQRKEEELIGEVEQLNLATRTAQPKRRARKYSTLKEARLARNARQREIYQITKLRAKSAEEVPESLQDPPQDTEDCESKECDERSDTHTVYLHGGDSNKANANQDQLCTKAAIRS